MTDVQASTQSSYASLDDARSERRFRSLAEAIPLIVWTAQADGGSDYQNRRWEEYSGLTAEQSAGSGWMQAVHPVDRARYTSAWKAMLQDQRRGEFEVRLRNAQGVFRWFLALAEPICDDAGKVVRWFGTCTDIDDRKRASDETVRKQDEQLKLAADAARLGYWDWDLSTDAISWSDGLERISGTSPEEFGLKFEGFLTLVHADDREPVARAVRQAIEQGHPYETEFRMARPDGTYRWCLTRGQVYYDHSGRAVRMSGIDVDITVRKEAEERLRQSEERFRQSIDTLIDCLAIYTAVRDQDGRIVDFRTEHVNPSACRNNRLTREQQVGRGLLELLPAHRECGLFEKYCRVVETGEPLDIETIFYEDDFGGERIGRTFSIRVSKLGDGYVAAWRDISDWKQAESQLKESLEFSRRIAEITPTVLYIFDIEEIRPVYHNRTIEALMGYSPEEVLALGSSAMATLIHPDDQVLLHEHFARMRDLGDGEKVALDYRVKDAKGQWRRFHAEESVFQRGADGRVKQVIGSAIDITGFHLADITTRDRHDRLRTFADSDIVGIVFADIHGGISFANDEYLRIIGYSREEFSSGGIRWTAITPPEWLPVDQRAIEEALAGPGACRPYEKEYIRKDGSRVPVLVGFTLIETEETVAFVLDISERKRTEAALREGEERLSLAIEGARLGMWDWDVQSGRVLWNRHHERIFGYEPGQPERTYRDFISRVHPDDLPAIEAGFQKAMDERSEYRFVHRVVWPSGKVRWVEAHGRFSYDSQGRAVRSLGILTDITDLKQAEEALREADRRKDEFLAMLAHELRNPLSVLSNAIQLFRSPTATADDLSWASGAAERQVKNLVRMTDDLQDISRITQGKIKVRKTRLDASTVVLRAAESVRPFFDSRGHELLVSVDAPLPLEGDPTRLEQVLTNLLNNAGKYTEKGRRIRLSAGVEADAVVLRVRDTGLGIAPEMLPRVFELYAQVDSSIARAQGGLGIGLALVRALVEMHGGQVSAASDGPGQGSEFTVRLPLCREFPGSSRAATDAPSLPKARPVRGRKLLIVDDNLDTLRSMAVLLQLYGHTVVTAEDGPMALEMSRAHRPEVVLMDLGLPGMSGYEVAESLRSAGLDNPALIAVSGYTQKRDREKSRLAGFDFHLAKPVDLETLLAILDKLD